MRWTSTVPFVMAIGLGVVAVMLGRNVLEARQTPGQNMLKVVVAARDLDPGYQLQAGDLGTAVMTKDSVPVEAVQDASKFVGRVVAIPIAKSQTVLESALAPPGSGIGLQALVPPGMRAVTIEVNESSGMGGLLLPGCQVDVVATLQNDRTRQTVARTIVENAKVTAVGQRITPRSHSSDLGQNAPTKSVTLLVTPKQAEAIELVATRTKPRLVLRGSNDALSTDTPGVTMAELLGGNKEQLATLSGAPQCLAGIVNGLSSSLQKTNDSERSAATPAADHEAAPPRMPTTVRRSVQVIRSGVESMKNFELIAAPGADGQEVSWAASAKTQTQGLLPENQK